MARAPHTTSFTEELAEFLASQPTREELLAYRPSSHWQRRAGELLDKQNEGKTSPQEQEELEEFAYAERLVRLIKAQLRPSKTG